MRIPSSPRSFGLASKLALVVSRRDKHKLGYQDLNDDDEEINVDEIHVDDYSIDVVTLPPITTSTTKSVTTSCRQAAEVLETPTTSKKEDVSIVATSRTSNVPQTIDVESNSFKRNLADVKSSSSSSDMHESKASVLEHLVFHFPVILTKAIDFPLILPPGLVNWRSAVYEIHATRI